MRSILKNTLFIFFLFACLIACRDDDDSTYTYDGFLYQNCQKKPYANIELNFYEIRDNAFKPADLIFLGSTSTDDSGFYSLTAASCSRIEVKDASGRLIFGRHCLRKSVLPAMEKTANPTTTYPIKILTDSSYTNLDTIYLNSPYFNFDTLFVGPFFNQQIFLSNAKIMVGESSDYYANRTIGDSFTIPSSIVFYWGLGMNHFKQVEQMKPPYSSPFYLANLSYTICGIGDTAVVDLRAL